MTSFFEKISSFFTASAPYTKADRLLCMGLCCFSGAMGALIFTYSDLWPLTFLFLIPYILVMLGGRGGWPTLFGCSFVWAFTYYVVMLLWFDEMRHMIFSGFDDATARKTVLAALLATSVIEAFIFSAVMSALRFFKRYSCKLAGLLAFCGLFVIAETVPEYMGDLTFPWGRLANLVSPFTPFIQSSSLFGGLFVSLLVLLVNSALALLLLRYNDRKTRIFAAAFAAGVLLLNTGFGAVRMALASNDASSDGFGVLLVQGNFGSDNKWSNDPDAMRDAYLELSSEALTDGTEVVVWPETAIVKSLSGESPTKDLLSEFSKQNEVVLIVGAFSDNETDRNAPEYNSCWIFTPDGAENPVYSKQVLVPMGEVVPFEDTMRKLMPHLFEDGSIISSTSKGESAVVVDTGDFKVGTFICYESVVPHIIRENTEQGAELLVMVTNDSWFGDSAALTQHLSHAKLRACENGRYVLRAANTGITAVISPTGEVVCSTDIGVRTTLKGFAAARSSRTLYSITGDLMAPLSLLYLTVLLVFGPAKKLLRAKKADKPSNTVQTALNE